MYCKKCGAQVNDEAVVCVGCGCAIEQSQTKCCNNNVFDPNVSSRNGVAVLLLCFFLGCFGIHRFYVGKTGTGIAQLLTLGGCGIWVLIDFIMILTGDFRDDEGKIVKL